jgi:plastocyanin
MRRLVGLLASVVLCLRVGSMAAVLDAQTAAVEPHGTHRIEINGFAFKIPTAAVDVGDTVVWVNKDIVPHTVTDQDRAFDSGAIAAGSSWKLVAKTPGTFHYVCTLHPNMTGTLIVRSKKPVGK